MLEKVPDLVSEAAAAVADGRTLDWDRLESSASGERDRAAIRRLRAVAAIGRLHNGLSLSGSINDSLMAHRAFARGIHQDAPAIWGPLRIREKIGHGRFGDVYRAWDPALDREVALKILRHVGDEAVENHVVEEGRLMARVRHQNVVTIYGAQRIDGVTGLWMEFIRGRTLGADLAERGPFDAGELTQVGIELCHALAAVHEAGLVHRDVKAQNVLREDGGRIVLGDFGTGREFEDSPSLAGGLVGTPAYLAPELFAGERVTPQSDLYSLGVLLFHLATGTYPVPGRSLRDLRDSHANGRRVLLESVRGDCPKRIVRAVETALDPDPARRFESAESMARALEACATATPSKRRTLGRMSAAVMTLIAAAVVSAIIWRDGHNAHRTIPFAERDLVLVTAFENRTGEPALDGALEYALERELANSSFVNVVPRPRIEDTLQLMRKPLDTRIDSALGSEVALRDGQIRAVIAGRVEKIDGKYSMSARILNPADESTANIVSEASIDSGDLVPAVGRVAIEIRHRLGETLPQLEASRPRLEKVATPSIRALRLYSQARALTSDVRLFGSASAPRAVEQLLRDALTDDPNFVWAHILMAHAVRAQGGRETEVLHHAERAAAAAEPGGVDRYIAVAELHAFRGSASSNPVERRRYFEQAVASFEAALQLQPDHFWALGCLMNISGALERFPGQPLIERYIAMRPNNVGVFGQAMNAALAVGNLPLARDYARRGSALDVSLNSPIGFSSNTAANLRIFTARDALHQRNPQQALVEADRLAADPRSRVRSVVNRVGLHLADLYLTLGRLDRVEQVATWIEPELSGRRLLTMVAMEREDRDALRAVLTRLFPSPTQALGGHGGLNASISMAFIDAGMTESARALLAATTPSDFLSIFIEGQLAVADGRARQGVELLERLFRREAGDPPAFKTRVALRLADVWRARGDERRAVAVLESVVRSDRLSVFEDLTAEYTRVRERLAQLYRKLGRIQEAKEIEADLRQLLAVASDDHPIKRRLDGLR